MVGNRCVHSWKQASASTKVLHLGFAKIQGSTIIVRFACSTWKLVKRHNTFVSTKNPLLLYFSLLSDIFIGNIPIRSKIADFQCWWISTMTCLFQFQATSIRDLRGIGFHETRRTMEMIQNQFPYLKQSFANTLDWLVSIKSYRSTVAHCFIYSDHSGPGFKPWQGRD